jgi:hypothetical protein
LLPSSLACILAVIVFSFLVFKKTESNKNSHRTWLNLAFSYCYEICFKYSCMIIAAINRIS